MYINNFKVFRRAIACNPCQFYCTLTMKQSGGICRTYLLLLLASFLMLGCTSRQPSAAIRYVATDSDTKLEVVDWGGKGIPFVFLSGLGHTAHVFDEFAPTLVNNYHVLGITRRGFGASSQPDSGYNVDTLAEDIRIILDSLNLGSVVLIGHSLGGDEMTLVAHKYPQTMKALVYIEAAYNRVTARKFMTQYTAPQSDLPPPTPADLESAEAYRAYYARINGVTLPLSEIRALYHWTSDGRRGSSITPSWIYSKISASIEDPDYSKIDIPALAIYATEYPVTELFIDYAAHDSTTRLAMRKYHEVSLQCDKLSRDYFRAHMVNGRVVEICGAGHSVYITHAQQTLAAIRTFLAEVL
jgi:non-heme chloroperoxidase